jgi:hypothetical protein
MPWSCTIYRAMAWLGEALPADQQDAATPFAPRWMKDLIEEQLFAHRRDLFSRLDLPLCQTSPRWNGSFARATRHWLATPAIAASSRPRAKATSPSIAPRRMKMPRFDGLFVLRTNTDLSPPSLSDATRGRLPL